MIDSKISLVVFTVLFIVTASTMANFFQVDGVNCTDPSNILEQPPSNATTVDKVVEPANDVVSVFFGCSSSNSLLNGVFLSLQAGIIIVLLFIVKDVIPFT